MRVPLRFVWFKVILLIVFTVVIYWCLIHIVKNAANPTKYIFIISYYRAGSARLGEILQQNSNTCYIFEPLSTYSFSRRIEKNETNEAINVIGKYFQCQFNIGPNINSSKSNNPRFTELGVQLMKWLTPLCLNFDYDLNSKCSPSPEDLSKLCLKCQNRVIRSVRIPMDDLGLLMTRIDPMVEFNVIYLVRDPRGIINSRMEDIHDYYDKIDDDTEIPTLCNQMKADIDTYNRLIKLYPGELHVLRHEDLYTKPEEKAANIYRQLGLTTSVKLKLSDILKSVGLRKVSPSEPEPDDDVAVNQFWTNFVDYSLIEQIQEQCQDVFKSLGYQNISADFYTAKQIVTEQLSITFSEQYPLANSI